MPLVPIEEVATKPVQLCPPNNIQQFLDKMGVQKAAIISHGLGAAVATILAENSA